MWITFLNLRLAESGQSHRLMQHGNNPIFKRLSERLEELRRKAEIGLI
ncbi:MAG: hypothetical protein JXB49_36865 [Bacteroidales bacterium]|nr:hypothetical protein [Bacteroidales bacterium]